MLHLGTHQLTSLASPPNLVAVALLAIGLVRAVAGPAPAQPVRARVFVPVSLLVALGWLGTPAAVVFAPGWSHPATFVYVACVIAWAWMLRDRQSDDDDRGGGNQDIRPDAPEDPSGGGIDWDAFESAFWSHVAHQRDRDLTPV
jgi:hypothetical protein